MYLHENVESSWKTEDLPLNVWNLVVSKSFECMQGGLHVVPRQAVKIVYWLCWQTKRLVGTLEEADMKLVVKTLNLPRKRHAKMYRMLSQLLCEKHRTLVYSRITSCTFNMTRCSCHQAFGSRASPTTHSNAVALLCTCDTRLRYQHCWVYRG